MPKSDVVFVERIPLDSVEGVHKDFHAGIVVAALVKFMQPAPTFGLMDTVRYAGTIAYVTDKYDDNPPVETLFDRLLTPAARVKDDAKAIRLFIAEIDAAVKHLVNDLEASRLPF